MTRDESIAAMRSIADIVEANPGVPIPNDFTSGGSMPLFCTTPEQWQAAIAAFGEGEYRDHTHWVIVAPVSFPHILLYGHKGEVFERTLVGTKHIPAHDEEEFGWRPKAVTA